MNAPGTSCSIPHDICNTGDAEEACIYERNLIGRLIGSTRGNRLAETLLTSGILGPLDTPVKGEHRFGTSLVRDGQDSKLS